jgi:hypothetical protein
MDISQGQLRARAWPKHRKRERTTAEVEREQTFANVQRVWNYYLPAGQMWMREATGPTPMLPRDMFTMMLYNRLFAVQMLNGKTIYPMPAKLDVERALDAITQTPGQTLIKTPTGWEGGQAGGGSAGFFRSNQPDPADFPLQQNGPSGNILKTAQDYGFQVRRVDSPGVGAIWSPCWTRPVPDPIFTATIGLKISNQSRDLQTRWGLIATRGDQWWGVALDSNGGANRIVAEGGANLAARAYVTPMGNCVNDGFVYVQTQCTFNRIFHRASWDGGRTWALVTDGPLTPGNTPTHVGPYIGNTGANNQAYMQAAVIFFEFS